MSRMSDCPMLYFSDEDVSVLSIGRVTETTSLTEVVDADDVSFGPEPAGSITTLGTLAEAFDCATRVFGFGAYGLFVAAEFVVCAEA